MNEPVALALPCVPLLGQGSVRHLRQRPRSHQFAYGTYFVWLPMRQLRAHGPGALARNRWAALSFYDADHGEGGPDALAWLEAQLAAHHITDADGEIWLHTFPRVLGYAFKPVSFWFCLRADGRLRAVLAEVHNTFGQRYSYLLEPATWGQTLRADKALHVSPFCQVAGHYRFCFGLTCGEHPRMVARIDYHDDSRADQPGDSPLLITSISGQLSPLTAALARRVLWRYPLMTWGVMARIHWQALRLWLKRTPWFARPI